MYFEALSEPLRMLVAPLERIYWVYLVGAIIIAFFVYAWEGRERQSSLLGFFSFLAPKKVWTHPSTLTDIGFFFINRVLFFIILAPLSLALFSVSQPFFYSTLERFAESSSDTATPWLVGLYAFLVLCVSDLARYFTHYLQHRVPFLWAFHKVHHSAEVLNVLTVYRMHPVDDLLSIFITTLLISAFHAVVSFFSATDFSFWTFGFVNLAAMAFYFFGYNLRHSHIWLSYGTFLSRWLISPAQHQIHHSNLPEHRDRNFGFMFAIWDRIFGTLLVPSKRMELELGLSEAEQARFSNPWQCYVAPFRETSSSSIIATGLLAACLAGLTFTSVTYALEEGAPKSVHLEEMTWTEVRDALGKRGFETVIIPTAGLEQNGRHLVLGKHLQVVRHASEDIALRLGDALVAPVINHVPEGSISPPDGHMRFAGTVSVRDSTFEAILEDTALSLVAHGFKTICFVGDSLGNQQIQAAVAERLSKQLEERFPAEGIQVLQIDNYYAANQQVGWLMEQGYTEEEIGGHAGIRDTSELLFVAPEWVRSGALRTPRQQDGVSGSYWKASAEIGQKMLELKVQAAVMQIQALRVP